MSKRRRARGAESAEITTKVMILKPAAPIEWWIKEEGYLAGRIDIDPATEPLGVGADGKPVYLRDIWPSAEEVNRTMAAALTPELFTTQYASVFEGDEQWQALPVPTGSRFAWDPNSTYIAEPPFYVDLPPTPGHFTNVDGARILAVLGDSVTTDHISPAGSIPKSGPAAKYLMERGVSRWIGTPSAPAAVITR